MGFLTQTTLTPNLYGLLRKPNIYKKKITNLTSFFVTMILSKKTGELEINFATQLICKFFSIYFLKTLTIGCPDPNGEGMRILRFNNELTRWDTAAIDEVKRRTLDTKNYGLKFGPVSAEDSGTYLCLINNRREPDALLELTVEGM